MGSKRRREVADSYDMCDIVEEAIIKIDFTSYFVFAELGHHAL